MTKDVIKRDRIVFRPKSGDVDVTPKLEAMAEAGVGKNDSDRIRLSLLAYKLPKRSREDCTEAKIKFVTKGAVKSPKVPA